MSDRVHDKPTRKQISDVMRELASRGGRKRADGLTPERRREIARKAGNAVRRRGKHRRKHAPREEYKASVVLSEEDRDLVKAYGEGIFIDGIQRLIDTYRQDMLSATTIGRRQDEKKATENIIFELTEE
jgi:hypothetical protein